MKQKITNFSLIVTDYKVHLPETFCLWKISPWNEIIFERTVSTTKKT